jgi:hypothetical protein
MTTRHNSRHPDGDSSVSIGGVILLIIIGAIAACSLLLNILLFSLHQTDRITKTRVESLQQQAAQAETSRMQAETVRSQAVTENANSLKKVDELSKTIEKLQTNAKSEESKHATAIARARSELDQVRNELDQTKRDPRTLDSMSKKDVLSRHTSFSVMSYADPDAKKLSVDEADIAADMRIQAANNGLVMNADAAATIFISVNTLPGRSSDDIVFSTIQLELYEYWRVPQTQNSFPVITSSHGTLIGCKPHELRTEVREVIGSLIADFARSLR